MCGETPQGPSSGTPDMHNKNKMACCSTGGLTTVVEWKDRCLHFFNLNTTTCSMWELLPSAWHWGSDWPKGGATIRTQNQVSPTACAIIYSGCTSPEWGQHWFKLKLNIHVFVSFMYIRLEMGDEPTWMPAWTAITLILDDSPFHSVETWRKKRKTGLRLNEVTTVQNVTSNSNKDNVFKHLVLSLHHFQFNKNPCAVFIYVLHKECEQEIPESCICVPENC